MIGNLHTDRVLRRRVDRGVARHRRGEGMPQAVVAATTDQLKMSLTDQPGLRLAPQRGRRVFFGGALTPQKFTRKPSSIQDDDAIRAGIRSMNASRAFSKTRGTRI